MAISGLGKGGGGAFDVTELQNRLRMRLGGDEDVMCMEVAEPKLRRSWLLD